jgi:hydrogenase maturation protease
MTVHDRSGVAGCGRRLVICYGNPLCGDDGVGWHIGRCLEEKKLPVHTRIVMCQQLTPDLAEPISRSAQVVFVDAQVRGRPGEVACTRIVPGATPLPPIGHATSPHTLLALSRWLYGKAPMALIYSVTGIRFNPGDGLSPEVEHVVPTLVSLLGDALGAVRQ